MVVGTESLWVAECKQTEHPVSRCSLARSCLLLVTDTFGTL